MPYLPYSEPKITLILSLASFIFLLNVTRYILNKVMYCGIIGEILIGIIWGFPIGGMAWLSTGTQESIQSLGYLGLIGLVFEGGLSTDLLLLRTNVGASVSVATIGLLMPVALSFVLLTLPFKSGEGMLYPTHLGAFSAGASLCSTSLGTTLAILSSAEMQKTKVGVVLVGAAMMDDVVGLVMVNIITSLGGGGTSPWPIARPIVASFGMLLVVLIAVPLGLKPIWIKVAASLSSARQVIQRNYLQTISKFICNIPHANFLLSSCILAILITIASFTDASILFAAFIAGGLVNYVRTILASQHPLDMASHSSLPTMYEEYYKPALDSVLVPFFFASIGFSIPITNMFSGSTVWKGILYSLLLILAKMLTSIVIYSEHAMVICRNRRAILQREREQSAIELRNRLPGSNTLPIINSRHIIEEEEILPKPHSTALLIGCAMAARGEIGFLIASLSQSSGTLTLQHQAVSQGEELYLVITWAVVLCTIAGPLGVGYLVKRVRQGNAGDLGFTTWI